MGQETTNKLPLNTVNKSLKPGERGYQLTCGCCAGPVEDRCCCWNHMDIPRGIRPRKCSLHAPVSADLLKFVMFG